MALSSKIVSTDHCPVGTEEAPRTHTQACLQGKDEYRVPGLPDAATGVCTEKKMLVAPPHASAEAPEPLY